MQDLSDRHPSTQQIAKFFAFDHLPVSDAWGDLWDEEDDDE